MKRGVGYCENTDCEDYAKGVFLLNHGDTFYCPRCRQLGKVEKERGFYTGNSDIFKEVRVEYNFDPINGIYREIAIVRDESLWGRNNVYTLQSPLIKTEKRALKVAEAILANLNRYRGLLNGDDIPRTTEIILSFDESFEEFQKKLHQLSKEARTARPLAGLSGFQSLAGQGPSLGFASLRAPQRRPLRSTRGGRRLRAIGSGNVSGSCGAELLSPHRNRGDCPVGSCRSRRCASASPAGAQIDPGRVQDCREPLVIVAFHGL